MTFWGVVGALNVFLSVALGAFGAHGLKGKIAPDLLDIYQTGVHYQMIHGLGLLLIAALIGQVGPQAARLFSFGAWALVVGVVLFSGSLYVLAMSGVRLWGAVTPFGGVAFLIGWVLVALAFGKAR
ncbi:MAG: DUF423 domain-containing protein [Hydrogenibacillus sp.]|nr:DUF423 domain-containing protein [Hydrogenibacillus sp.]